MREQIPSYSIWASNVLSKSANLKCIKTKSGTDWPTEYKCEDNLIRERFPFEFDPGPFPGNCVLELDRILIIILLWC